MGFGSAAEPALAAAARAACFPLGTGWTLAAVCRAPGGVRRLPAAARLLLFHRALGPSGGWWLRDRVEGVVPVRTSCRVTRAEASGSAARLELTGPGGSERLAVDHMLAATGYRLDIDALAFLAPALRRGVVRVPGSKAPRLTSTFETSVPGLYVSGSLAAPMFGPMMRFVAGTEYAAARVARDAARWVVAP
ncbi:hypothetical protein [Streptomyces mirabilis]|uniref:hypothetical protein n=1 Tax=Streptomyces mirabilis TaxID=68239 RepID=UPI002257D413|nr:hypothetical protein [Streptomyces mirabilis]